MVVESFLRMAFLKRMAIKLAFCCILACDRATVEEEEEDEEDEEDVWITIFGFAAPAEELAPWMMVGSWRARLTGVSCIGLSCVRPCGSILNYIKFRHLYTCKSDLS